MRECGLPPLLTAPDCAATFFLQPFHDLQYFPHVYRRHCRPSLFLPVFPQFHAFQSLLPQSGSIAQYPAESKSLESFRIQKLLSLLGTQQAGHAKIQRLMDAVHSACRNKKVGMTQNRTLIYKRTYNKILRKPPVLFTDQNDTKMLLPGIPAPSSVHRAHADLHSQADTPPDI